jgi:D-beta-D-heptose 7-phosphate kinase/D-beta-D-heptose 1-phosphate adenosyltransferase
MKDLEIIQQQKQYKILLVGDAGVDTYTYGNVNRISPEAPVPVFEPVYDIVKDGMASNVRKNLEALGCAVTYIHTEISRKQRLIDIRSKQQLIRIDRDVECKTLLHDFKNQTEINTYDAVIISDYNKGTVNYELITHLIKTVSVPIFIDTKKTNLSALNGCYIKINSLEKSRATSMPHPEWLIVTHGEHGAEWNGWVYPAEIVGEVTDVCGAGDTFLAALVYKFLETNHMPDAIKFAIKASAVTVQHVGVYAPRLEEIK